MRYIVPLQEKSQVVATEPPEPSHQWTSAKSQRHTNETPDTTQFIGIPDMTHSAAAPTTMQMSHNNEMPVGYDRSDGNGNNTGPMPLSIAGATDASDKVTAETMRDGCAYLPMPPDSREEQDETKLFYDDVGGFVIRGGYMDRN